MTPGGNQYDAGKPEVDAALLVQRLIRDMHKLERRLRKVLEALEEMCWSLYRIEKILPKTPRPGRVRHVRLIPAPAAVPAPAIKTFDMQNTAGGAIATFDDDEDRRVALSPTLQAFLNILAEDDGFSADGLVGWKSFDRIANSLQKQLKRRFDNHAVSQLLWRLRKTLAASKLDRSLVEKSPALGVRLRLKRRQPAALCAG
jgi:hypothetical protein